MSEDKTVEAFFQAVAEEATKRRDSDAALGRFLREAYHGDLLAAMTAQDPRELLNFCAKLLVGHVIASRNSGGLVITCTDFHVNENHHGDWQVIIAPHDAELAEAIAEQQRGSGDGTIH